VCDRLWDKQLDLPHPAVTKCSNIPLVFAFADDPEQAQISRSSGISKGTGKASLGQELSASLTCLYHHTCLVCSLDLKSDNNSCKVLLVPFEILRHNKYYVLPIIGILFLCFHGECLLPIIKLFLNLVLRYSFLVGAMHIRQVSGWEQGCLLPVLASCRGGSICAIIMMWLLQWLQWLQWGVTFSQVVWLIGCWLVSASHK